MNLRTPFGLTLTLAVGLAAGAFTLTGCPEDEPAPTVTLAEDIYAPLGQVLPTADETQRWVFDRGRAVATRRFTPEEGLGPLFNVTFCAACHERPVTGGSAGHYRDFALMGQTLSDGSFLAADMGGVLTAYGNGDAPTRPHADEDANVMAGRNPIPFFGVGLIAELPEEAILANADPDDADGDGISGRPNYENGFVGRFGRKSQTTSIEGFIRGPLNNHLGVTSDPLPETMLDALPVPSGRIGPNRIRVNGLTVVQQAQAAAPTNPLTDDDEVPDPELSAEDLYDLVAFSMLLAAPQPEPLGESGLRGQVLFDELNCAGCHVAALPGPRGALPLYSDLLLHDMGEALDDGISQGVATGREFRTQPLWGVAAVGPYLHDGRADTLTDAILLHGGEAERARDAFAALDAQGQADVIEFLLSLGGRSQSSSGLLPPGAAVPESPEPGCPVEPLEGDDLVRFEAGRELYDRDMGVHVGLGPLFNGDSCRACHFDPVLGGAGPLDVNVMRHGTWTGEETFEAPSYGTILHKLAVPGLRRREHTSAHNTFEPRQTPATFGLGLLESVDAETILALADPEDDDGDGIRGVAHVLPDGRLGRFGWKAQVPTVREFVRDAMSAELGLTVPAEDGLTFGVQADDDDAPDPELALDELDDLSFFIENLDFLHPVADVPEGRQVFVDVGCANCHVPELPGANGPVPAYTDLLLHDVQAEGYRGIEDGTATGGQFRTPPLWGLSRTAPYLHDGSAATVQDAIEAHAGEATQVVTDFRALDDADAARLVEFLESL